MSHAPGPEDATLWRELGLDVEFHAKVLDSIHAHFARQVTSHPDRPAGMAYFDGVILGAHGPRVREIMARQAEGAKFVGTFCVYVPEEILLALDAVYLALCGGTAVTIPHAEKTFPRNMCPLVKSTLGLAFSGTCPYGPLEDLSVGETTCDAKKKTWDVLGREGGFHVLELPQKKGPADRALWAGEVKAFARRIEELTGRTLESEKLAGAVRLMNRKRRALAQMHEWRKADIPPISGTDALVIMQSALIDDTARFTRQLEFLNEELAARAAAGTAALPKARKRVMVSGCPSVLGNWKLHHLLESAGAAVVLDESCTGTRYFTGEVEETDATLARRSNPLAGTAETDPQAKPGAPTAAPAAAGGDLDSQLEAVAARYMGIDCSCFSPNTERTDNILQLAREYRADGVVQYILHACHTFNIEAITVAEALKGAGIPSIRIETDYSEEDVGQLRIRLEAFLESLEFRHDA
jgi:benzoyl-CoA reductase/2-hydroxyglutaryl-CoA dehydratase subunit BcrC/BadD/HgdB